MRRLIIRITCLAAILSPPLSAWAATLDQIKARGHLTCGVNTGVAGFSAPDTQGVYHGLDVDYCHALAAAVLGDPAKIRFMPTSYSTRFVLLQSGEIDVLARNVTITRANAEAMRASTDPDIRRLLGTEPGLGKALGLDEDWASRAIRAVGNYGESFDRNLGKDSPIKLERGLNALWSKGGLLYPLPLR